MKLDIFDPANPFGETTPTPLAGIDAEIAMLAADFAKLGVSASSAVPLWLGKPNRFTSTIMRSAKEVLDYIAAELAEQAALRAEAHGQPAPGPSQADPDAVVSATDCASDDAPKASTEAKRLHRERVAAANDAWRKAIRDRAAAVVEWDKYVEHLRSEYQKVKLLKP